jgi:hypothetical protein
MEYLPSKNFIQKAAIGLLLFGGWFYFFGADKNPKIITQNNISQITKNTTNAGNNPSMWEKIFGGNKDASEKTTKNNLLASVKNSVNLKEETVLSKFKKTTASDLNSFSGATRLDYENYGKELVAALRPYANPGLANEGEVTMNAIASGDHRLLQKVTETANIHLTVADDLQKIKVPEEIKFRHLFLINDIRKISYLDGVMLLSLENPSKAFEAVNQYKLATISFMNSIVDINDFFKEQGINFSEGEKIQIYINSVQ